MNNHRPHALDFKADFVNRSRETRTFENLCSASAHVPLPTVCFHGPGGVGKSWLRQHFERIADERSIPWVVIDYLAPPSEDRGALLFYIAAALKQASDCEEFFTAYGLYLHKSHLNSLLSPQLNEVNVRGKSILDALMQADIIKTGVTSTVVTIAGLLPVFAGVTTELGAAAAGLSVFLGPAMGACINFFAKAEKEKNAFYQKYSSLSPEAIYGLLAEALANDLDREKQDDIARRCRAVVFFDTVERLHGAQQTDVKSPHEEWITKFAEQSKRTLVVLTGHNPLRWKKYNDPYAAAGQGHWDKKAQFTDYNAPPWPTDASSRSVNLLQYELLDLREADSRRILENNHIMDAALQQAVLEACHEPRNGGYHPFSLDLCVETLYALERRDGHFPAASAFSMPRAHHGDIINRYLGALGEEERRWIKTLAFTLRFDRAAAKAAYGAGGVAASDAACDALLQRCYVSKLPSVSGWYVLHGNMQKHIRTVTPSTSNDIDAEVVSSFNARQTHEFWRDYWRSRQGAA